MAELLTGPEREEKLAGLPGWQTTEGETDAIQRIFKFKNFKQAFDFMKEAAGAAEEMDHHPDWCNSYNKVDVQLSTHFKGGLTDNDIELARRMDRIAEAVQEGVSA